MHQLALPAYTLSDWRLNGRHRQTTIRSICHLSRSLRLHLASHHALQCHHGSDQLTGRLYQPVLLKFLMPLTISMNESYISFFIIGLFISINRCTKVQLLLDINGQRSHIHRIFSISINLSTIWFGCLSNVCGSTFQRLKKMVSSPTLMAPAMSVS